MSVGNSYSQTFLTKICWECLVRVDLATERYNYTWKGISDCIDESAMMPYLRGAAVVGRMGAGAVAAAARGARHNLVRSTGVASLLALIDGGKFKKLLR